MNGVTITWEMLLVAVVVATVVYLLEAALFTRRRKPNAQPEAMRDLDLDVEGLHRRVLELERTLRDVRQQIKACKTEWDAAREALQEVIRDVPPAAPPSTAAPPAAPAPAPWGPELQDTPYAQAVQMARQGISPQELARRCGITNGEAELIVALNRGEP